MGEKRPQPTPVLVKRLRRAAKALTNLARLEGTGTVKARLNAHANTCWQAAGRLEDLEKAREKAANYVGILEVHGIL